MEVDVILIRKSPILAMWKLLSMIFIVSVLYSVLVIGMGITEYDIFKNDTIIEYDFLFFCVYVLLIAFAAIFIMLRWMCDSYEVRKGEVVHKSGVFRKDVRQYAISNTENIHLDQSIWGRLFKYGTLTIYNPLQKTEIHINGIVDPELQLHIIKGAIQKDDVNQLVPFVSQE